MSDISKDMLDLVLGYEELVGSEREAADRILADNPELARHLDALRAKERQAADPVPLGSAEEFWNPSGGASVDPRRLRRSLEELRVAVGVQPATRRPFLHARWMIPLAAVLALALILPHWVSRPDGLSNLRVLRLTDAGLDTRSAVIDGNDEAFRTGESIALNFRLERPAFVAFCLVGAEGGVTFIDPRLDEPLAAGTHTYPDAAAAGRWILNDAVGRETFLVAIQEDEFPYTLGLGQAMARLEGQGGREQTVSSAKRLLEKRFAEVRVISFEHVD